MSASRRKFDKAFKQEAVRLALEDGKSVAEIVRNHGFSKMFFIIKKEVSLSP